jgi:hypothetical protein
MKHYGKVLSLEDFIGPITVSSSTFQNNKITVADGCGTSVGIYSGYAYDWLNDRYSLQNDGNWTPTS